MDKKLTLGSLFDGSGGFPLGGLLADISPLWASEVEPFAIRVTTKRMPYIKHYGDISQMDGGKIEPVDIITFGSPCQDMSVAGKRSGLEGSRSCLFYEAVRIIKEMRSATNGNYPRYAVWENVPGAFSSNGGKDFKAVLDSLVGIVEEETEVPLPEKGEWAYADCIMGDRWSIAYRVLDAQYWGVPQRRRRIYLVADFNGRSAADVLFKSEGLSRYSAEGFRAWQRAANHSQNGVGTAGIGFDGYNGDLTDDVSATLGVNCGMSTGRNGVVLNDQGGNRMDVTHEVTCTLRAEAHHPPVVMDVFDNHGKDVRYTGPIEVAPTISATYGTGGNNQPFVVGKSWDGGEISPTLTKQNAGGNQRMPDKDNFNCVLQPYGISAKDSNAMKSSNPKSGIYEAKTARTLDGNGGNPACNQGGIAVVCVDQGGGKSSCQITVDKTPTLTCTHGGEPAVCTPKEEKESPVYAMTTGSFTQVEEGRAPTLMARDFKDPNAVCYGIGRSTFNQGKNGKFSPTFEKELQPTMVAKGPGAVAVGVADYTVRRLTPVECARLQGFPDWWCQGLGTEKPTDAEVYFWYKVFETHRRITGEGKPKTDKQLRRWLNDPYSDSAEYKLWGNGVALPCVFFVLSGIAWASGND